MANGTQIVADTLRVLASGAITGNFVAIGTPFLHPVRIVEITNLTNQTLILSYNGIDDQAVIPAESGKVLDISAARTGGSLNAAFLAINTTIYARSRTGAAAGDSIFVEAYYMFGD